MSTNLIEHIRSLHGEIESDKNSIVEEFLTPETKHKKQVLQSHKIKAKLARVRQNQRTLVKLYEDKSGALAASEKSIRAKNNLGVFYSRLNGVLTQKKAIAESKRLEDGAAEPLNLRLSFAGEEFYGKYVEMNELYQAFLNVRGMPSMYLNGIKKIDYKLYLEVFDHFHNIPHAAKASRAYRAYCGRVRDYLSAFYARRHPLHPVRRILREIEEDFEEKWAAGNIAGWQKEWPAEVFQKHPSKSAVSLDERKRLLQAAERADAAAKDTKSVESRFCEACGRAFKASVWSSHAAGKRHLKNAARAGDAPPGEGGDKRTARLEFGIKVLKTLLAEAFEETVYYVEKKLTRSFAEIQKELEQREADDEEDEELLGDEVESRDQSLWSGGVYNPKKVPLGWDGRPIPYWLYKFHGLNIAYKCEICGGTNYYGPRAFQQHFKEWKHAHGMKALGLPNTKHFHNVTKIDEAEALYRKLKEKKLIEMFNPQLEEEFEDHDGNVYGKQTYEALKRQRVI